MNQKEENYLSMATATVKVLEGSPSIWRDNAPVKALVKDLQITIDAINTAQQGGGIVSTGVTLDKEQAANTAIEQAVLLAGFAQAYARHINNNTLHDQLKVSRTSLDRIPDNELGAALRLIYNKLLELSGVSEPYGITPEELKILNEAILIFEDVKSNPRVVITERKGYNSSIPVLLRELRSSFYKLDRLVNIWSKKETKFVSDYQNARIVIDLGTRKKGSEEEV